MKKLIVFCDGTWNSADQKSHNGDQPCPTNVARLFEATAEVDHRGHDQIVHYIRGVGTRFMERISGGGFGFGISDNIKEGYQFICSNYEDGDQIYLVGFSRGAYTARSIAGFIHNLGILKRPFFPRLNEAFGYYRDKSAQWHPDSAQAIEFQDKYCWPTKNIYFLGVWDTVGALGAPYGIVLARLIGMIFNCSFHDTKLSSSIQSAYHALAKDEHRWPFRPTLWQLNEGHKAHAEDFQEKWFPGVHSDVGGGYPEMGLSDIALEWMANNAIAQGLHVDLDKLAFPVFKPNAQDLQHDSQTLVYRIATLVFVKLPFYLGIAVPGAGKALIRHINLKGDFIRPHPKN